MVHLVPVLGVLAAGGPENAAPEAPSTAPVPQTSAIEVRIAPVRVDDGGRLLVAVFADEESWLDLQEALFLQSLPADSDTLRVLFEEVPLGDYALKVVHDANKNGKLDMRKFPFPKPKEGVGVSNNHRRMGKPEFSKALFSAAADTTRLNVDLVY